MTMTVIGILKIGLGLNLKKMMQMTGADSLGEHLAKYQFREFMEKDWY